LNILAPILFNKLYPYIILIYQPQILNDIIPTVTKHSNLSHKSELEMSRLAHSNLLHLRYILLYPTEYSSY